MLPHHLTATLRCLLPAPPHPADAVAAFRQFTHAQHVGKIVISIPPPAPEPHQAPAGASGSWVISGGLGALGALAASWLVGQGQRHLLLLGRSGRVGTTAGEGSAGGAGTLGSSGGLSGHSMASGVLSGHSMALVTMLRCDTAAAAEAPAALLPPGPAGGGSSALPAPAGFINSGGVLRDAVLSAQTAAGMRAVFAPKLASAATLAPAAGAVPLQQLLLFSSAASLLGAPGQANYAAANAALEGWAGAAAGAGLPAAAVQWGAWAVGMAADEAVAQRAARTGLGLIAPAPGLDALRSLLLSRSRGSGGGAPLGLTPAASPLAAVPVNWSVLLRAGRGAAPPFFFGDVAPEQQQQPAAPAAVAAAPAAAAGTGRRGATPGGGPSWGRRQRPRQQHPHRQRSTRSAGQGAGEGEGGQPSSTAASAELLASGVAEVARQILGAQVAPGQPLMEAGLDSLGEQAAALVPPLAGRCRP